MLPIIQKNYSQIISADLLRAKNCYMCVHMYLSFFITSYYFNVTFHATRTICDMHNTLNLINVSVYDYLMNAHISKLNWYHACSLVSNIAFFMPRINLLSIVFISKKYTCGRCGWKTNIFPYVNNWYTHDQGTFCTILASLEAFGYELWIFYRYLLPLRNPLWWYLVARSIRTQAKISRGN